MNEQLATECHPSREQKIHTIRAAKEVLVYNAQKVATSK
jgi:hypothetical protein